MVHASSRGYGVIARFVAVFGLMLAMALPIGRSVASESEPRPDADLPLAAAVDLAIRDNPQLQRVRAQLAATRERPAQARAWANPMFTYGGMDRTDSGDWPDTAEKRFMLEQEIPWFGKRELRRAMAEQDVEIMRHDLEAMTRDVAMNVKENGFDWAAVRRALAIIRDEDAVIERMVTVTETRYATGVQSQSDVIKAQTERSMLKQKRLELESQEAVLTAKLNRLLNRPPDAPLSLIVPPPSLKPDDDFQPRFALAAMNRPEIRGVEADLQRRRLERDLMQKEFRPDWRVGIEYRDLAGSENMAMFTVGMDLPFRRSSYRAAAREAELMVVAGEAEREEAERQVFLDVQDAYFKLRAARRTLELYRNELIPQAEARLNASEAGYRTGKNDFMDLLESERFLLDARVMAVMTEGAVGGLTARLEWALGRESGQKEERETKSP